MFNTTLVEATAMIWRQVKAQTDRHLEFGPVVPEGEVWLLTNMLAKNNDGPTTEIGCVVYNGKDWGGLNSVHKAVQYQSCAWSGQVVLTAGMQIGWWFRQAAPGAMLDVCANWNVLATGSSPAKAAKKETKEAK